MPSAAQTARIAARAADRFATRSNVRVTDVEIHSDGIIHEARFSFLHPTHGLFMVIVPGAAASAELPDHFARHLHEEYKRLMSRRPVNGVR